MVNRKLCQFVITVVALALASCDATIHFYPEANDDNSKANDDSPKAFIRLNVDWSGYGKNIPTGMTVLCHHTETGEMRRTIDNNTAYVTPRLSRGRHWASVFNLTEDEFNHIGFRGLDAVETAEAYALPDHTSKWYSHRACDDELVAAQPEWLAVDTIMTDHVDIDPMPDSRIDQTKVIGTLHPKNIIYTLHVTLHTENIGNLRSARGAITGFANGRKFTADRPNSNDVTVTHLIESSEWTRSRTSSHRDLGLVRTDIRCFGLPGNHQGVPDENTLEFQALLADGKTIIRYTFPVGNLIKEATPPPGRRGDNLDLYLEMWLDPSLPPGEGDDDKWGFDAWVDDWDEEEVEIPIF